MGEQIDLHVAGEKNGGVGAREKGGDGMLEKKMVEGVSIEWEFEIVLWKQHCDQGLENELGLRQGGGRIHLIF